MRICSPSVPRLKHEWNHTVGLIINLRCGTAVRTSIGGRKLWGWGRAASAPGRTDLGVLGVVGALAMKAAQWSRMWKHPSSGLHSAQSSVRPDFVSGVSSSAPVRSSSSSVAVWFHAWKVSGPQFLLLLLVWLVPSLAVKTRQN